MYENAHGKDFRKLRPIFAEERKMVGLSYILAKAEPKFCLLLYYSQMNVGRQNPLPGVPLDVDINANGIPSFVFEAR